MLALHKSKFLAKLEKILQMLNNKYKYLTKNLKININIESST